MKTRNNTQKTISSYVRMMIIRGSVVIFSFVLISLTSVSAQNFWKEFISANNADKMNLVSVDRPTEFKKADKAIDIIKTEYSSKLTNTSNAFIIHPEADDEMNIEAWMSNELLFNANSARFADETDEELKMEDWMINSSNFKTTVMLIEDEQDIDLKLENWMSEDINFESNVVITESDNMLKVENWMIEESNFNKVEENKPLQLEAWMSDENLW